MVENPMSKLLLIDLREPFESTDRNQVFIVSEFCEIPRQMIKIMETTTNNNIPTVCVL